MMILYKRYLLPGFLTALFTFSANSTDRSIELDNSQIQSFFMHYRQQELDIGLLLATYYKDTKKVKEYLQSGADPNARNPYCPDIVFTLAHFPNVATSFYFDTPLYTACKNGNQKIVQQLLEWGANTEIPDAMGQTPLHCASECGHLEIVRLLIAHKAHINARDKLQQTPLHLATSHVTEFLLDQGADIEACTSQGKTPLHHECLFDNTQKINILLERNADVNTRDKKGRTPLHEAIAYSKPSITWLVHDRGEETENDDQPFSTVTEESDLSIIQLLLGKGASITAMDNKGDTPVYKASKKGLDIAYLLHHGIDDGHLINSRVHLLLAHVLAPEDYKTR